MKPNRTIANPMTAVCILVLLSCPIGVAKTIYVDDDASAPSDGSSWADAYKYLQDALAAAELVEKPVEIRVAQGTYRPDRSAATPQGTGYRGSYFLITDGISLLGGYAGLSGPNPDARDIHLYQTILSGDLLGNDAPVTEASLLENEPTRNDNSEVIRVSCGEVLLEGCTITGGGLGGLYMFGVPPSPDSTVRIRDCTFEGNCHFVPGAPRPGGVSVVAMGDVVFVRCSFIGNAGYYGAMNGIIERKEHGITIDHCLFTRNYAGPGGGGGAILTESTITNCVFTENRSGAGGALTLRGTRRTNHVSNCVFRGNRAKWGGAILFDGHSDVRDCVFVGNEATVSGGVGLIAGTSADVKMSNCLLVGNRAGQEGGAWVARYWKSLEIRNCTIAGNRAARGSSLAVDPWGIPGPIAISNCILSNEGDEIWSDGSPVEIAYSCIPGVVEATDDPNAWLILGAGNIQADPCFADPGYWDPNGTPDDPNDAFFIEGDYHLKSQAGRWDPATAEWIMDEITSLCIDAGDPDSPIGLEPFPNGGRINLGAYGGTAEASRSYSGEPVLVGRIGCFTAD